MLNPLLRQCDQFRVTTRKRQGALTVKAPNANLALRKQPVPWRCIGAEKEGDGGSYVHRSNRRLVGDEGLHAGPALPNHLGKNLTGLGGAAGAARA